MFLHNDIVLCTFTLISYPEINKKIYHIKKENDTLTLHFLLLPFDTPTWHVLSCVTMKEKMYFFLTFHPWDTCVFQNYKQRTTYLNWANHLVFSSSDTCVLQNYTQRTTYLNWANHLVFSSLRHVCVPKLHTANHLFELSLPLSIFIPQTSVFQNYTQRTTYLNWANHLDLPPLKHMCVFQNYTQRTTYLNWANHLVFSPLRHVCVPKLHTANHLFELS